jgi:general L-amino acid transport system permease protein
VTTSPLQEPIPVPEEGPPLARLGAREWVRQNLFRTWFDTALTVVFALIVAWALYRAGRFVFVTGRWDIIDRNLTNLLVFRFPRDELWRVWTALFILAGSFGVGAGSAARARDQAVAEGRITGGGEGRLALRRFGPVLLLVAVLLYFAGTPTAFLLTAGVAGVAAAARFAGYRIPPRRARWGLLTGLVGLIAAFAAIVGFGGVGWDRWGGLMLTIFLAVGGIAISFPIGVLLALGRRSTFPAVRLVCVAYIELIRGVPLITVLFLGAFMLGFFLPPGTATPSLETRALVALVIFTAAYVAEIVRGGLQAVPRGQVEAAYALGLSPPRTTALIVLPQALRAVIPAMVGQFITLFKDTSLVAIIGITELLGASSIITSQPDFIGQGLIFETLLFAAFVYWVGSYSMSRESQRLERRLGVGQR